MMDNYYDCPDSFDRTNDSVNISIDNLRKSIPSAIAEAHTRISRLSSMLQSNNSTFVGQTPAKLTSEDVNTSIDNLRISIPAAIGQSAFYDEIVSDSNQSPR